MKFTPFAAALCVAAFPAIAAPLVPDQPVSVGSAEVVCTGVGSAKDDPQWNAYPIRMVFSNAGGQFVSGTSISLSNSSGSQIGTWECETPWALLRLPTGNYRASVRLHDTNQTRSVSFRAGAMRSAGFNGGQQRVEIQFPLPPNQ